MNLCTDGYRWLADDALTRNLSATESIRSKPENQTARTS